MHKAKRQKKLHSILQTGYHGFSFIILLLFVLGVYLSYLLGGFFIQHSNRNNFASHIIRYGDDFSNYHDPVNNNIADLILSSYEVPSDLTRADGFIVWLEDPLSPPPSAIESWVEILDDQYNVIRVIGNKRTNLMHYTTLDLMPNIDADYSYSIAPFVNEDGETNILLAAISSSTSVMRIELTGVSFIICASVFIVLFILLGFLYSKWSAEKITKPLTHITEAIKNSGDDGILMNIQDFSATVELEEIKNAFNALSQRLIQVKQDREQLLSNRNRMIMDISHDIKTPVTTIAGYARALAEDVVTDEETKKRYTWTLYEKSLRVGKLVDDLFTLTKLDVSSDIIFNECDLVELVQRIVSEHYTEFEINHIEIICEFPEKPIICKIDSQSISRAIANLIENAKKYADKGGVLAVKMQEDNENVVIHICDNGEGISATLREHIFEPFVRGDKSRTVGQHEKGGTGLGLAIAKAAIEKHGGKLELIDSAYEYRTIFQITLPTNR